VLCDELHDLNEAAFRILDALIDRPQCYFVGAGDKDQVIHAKLGASDEYLNRRFAERYPKLQRYPLTQTWRHGPHLAYAMAEFKQKQVESGLPLRTEIRQAHYAARRMRPARGGGRARMEGRRLRYRRLRHPDPRPPSVDGDRKRADRGRYRLPHAAHGRLPAAR
jgi:superfamily I DNA/RNA helicase